MRAPIVAVAIVVLGAASAAAGEPWRPFETTDEARQRHSAERYQQQQRNGTPWGGYKEKLGDTAPWGADRPGYVGQEQQGQRSYNYGRRRRGY
jgi:hypothetical protein